MNKQDWILRNAVVFLALVFFYPATTDSRTQRKLTPEQTDFGADSGLERPIPVPEAALKALRNARLQATPDELSSEQLQASEIHLDGLSEVDLVVPVLGGGHAAFFYILRPTSDGYQLIFDSGGDSMTVLRTRSHGYRDLQVEGITMAGKSVTMVIYRFDGHKYVKASEKTEHSN
jgi:hypothetical protein